MSMTQQNTESSSSSHRAHGKDEAVQSTKDTRGMILRAIDSKESLIKSKKPVEIESLQKFLSE